MALSVVLELMSVDGPQKVELNIRILKLVFCYCNFFMDKVFFIFNIFYFYSPFLLLNNQRWLKLLFEIIVLKPIVATEL